MVVGHPDYKNQARRVPEQMAAMRAHYGRIVVLGRNGAGPSHVAMGWAASERVHYAAISNVGGATRQHVLATGEALVALRPALCLSFGDCPEAEVARAAGIPTYEV